MDINFYLTGGVIIVIALIIFNHQAQKNRMENFLGKSAGTQPLFLQKSVEMKIQALNSILYANGMNTLTSRVKNDPKQSLINVFEKAQKNFADNKITLRIYDQQLSAILERANKLFQGA